MSLFILSSQIWCSNSEEGLSADQNHRKQGGFKDYIRMNFLFFYTLAMVSLVCVLIWSITISQGI